MAASYWDSTQHLNWEKSRVDLVQARAELDAENQAIIKQFPLPDYRHVNIHLQTQIARLGRRFQARQTVLATAQVFMRRFLTQVEIRQTNPYLMLATAFYVACKIEECPQHIRVVVAEARNLWPDLIQADTAKMGECEFHLISETNANLIVHHPYRGLTELQSKLLLSQEEMNLAWSIVNDHYLTDLVLLYPPNVIAATAVIMSVVTRSNQGTVQVHSMPSPAKLAQTLSQGTLTGAENSANQSKWQALMEWLTSSNMDIGELVDCVQEMISLYTAWETYSDKECREGLNNFIKAQKLDS